MTGGSARAVVANTAVNIKIKMAGTAACPTDAAHPTIAKMADLQKSGTVNTAEALTLRGRGRGWCGLWLRDYGGGRFVAAFLVGALPGDTGALQVLLDHVVRAA